MSKQKELAKNTFIITIGKICTQFVSFLLLPLYTGMLTAAEYGTVDIIITYTTLLTHVVLMGMDQAIFRFLVDVRENNSGQKTVVTTAFMFALLQIILVTVMFVCISPFIVFEYKVFLLLNVIASICVNMMLQTVRGLGDIKGYSLGSFLVAALQIVGNILLLTVFFMGARGMLIALAIGQLAAALYLFLRNRIYRYIGMGAFSKKELKNIMKYSLPLVPNALSWWVLQASDRTIVMLMLGQTMSGQMTVAHKFSNIFYLVYQIFHVSWMESAALYMDKPDSENFFESVIKKMFRFFISMGIGIIAVLPFIFSLLIKGEYREAYCLVPLLILSVAGNVVAALYAVFYNVKKKTGVIATSSVVGAGINIVVHLLLIPYIGIYAAAVSSIAAFGYMAIYRYINVRKFIKINLSVKDILIFAGMFIFTCISYYKGTKLIQATVLLVDFIICMVMNRSLIKSGVINLKELISRKNKK